MALSSILAAQDHADCATALEICKKQTYNIDRAFGIGRDDHTDLTACFMNSENFGQAEENSTWIKFEIAKSGLLTFSLRPHNADNDLDFVLYRLPPSGECDYKQVVRCMASGAGGFDVTVSPCMGETGLRAGETEDSEDAGCGDSGDNAWLRPAYVKEGEKYVLLVSNVSEAGPGFSATFGGTCMLPCDKEPEKPKEKPKPVEKPKPKPVVVASTPPPALPTEIEGRVVEVGESVKVKSRTLKLKIWDSQVEDGDIVSVYVDDKKVIDHVYLRLHPQEFEVALPPGKEHYITVYADDFGKAEPNTAMVLIDDGSREQTIDLVAGRKKQESVKVTVE